MKPYAFTDNHELLNNPSSGRENAGDGSSSEQTGTVAQYPREMNKGGFLISVIISVVVMVILLVSTR